MFPFIWITIFNDKEHSIWPLNIAIKNNYHTYNSFIKVYYFSSPVMMSLFHLAPQKLPGNFAMFSLLSIREWLSINNTIFIIGWTILRCSAPTASSSLSLIVHTIPYLSGNILIMRAANYLDYNQPSEERLPSESFFICFCTIFILVMSEWNRCTILPKIHLLYAVFFSNIWDSRHLLVRSIQVEA